MHNAARQTCTGCQPQSNIPACQHLTLLGDHSARNPCYAAWCAPAGGCFHELSSKVSGNLLGGDLPSLDGLDDAGGVAHSNAVGRNAARHHGSCAYGAPVPNGDPACMQERCLVCACCSQVLPALGQAQQDGPMMMADPPIQHPLPIVTGRAYLHHTAAWAHQASSSYTGAAAAAAAAYSGPRMPSLLPESRGCPGG